MTTVMLGEFLVLIKTGPVNKLNKLMLYEMNNKDTSPSFRFVRFAKINSPGISVSEVAAQCPIY